MYNFNSNYLHSMWRHHQEFIKQDEVQTLKDLMSVRNWWKQTGAFLMVLPRQAGKSTFLEQLIDTMGKESCILICAPGIFSPCFEKCKSFYAANDLLEDGLRGLNTENINLLIDEFTYIGDYVLNNILDFPWKSVTMVGTLK